jgi:hypothetical protein
VTLHKRLEKLEGQAAAQARAREAPQRSRERSWERYFHAHENVRREIEGCEPLPDLPYTEEDREDDRRFLEETIPAYRTLPGWRSGEGREILDHWEQHTRERLEKGA